MKGHSRSIKVRYAVEAMHYDAAARGWSKADLIRQAQAVAARLKQHVPKAGTFYYFLAGTTVSPRLASLLAQALGKPATTYLIDPTSRNGRAAA